MGYARYVGRVGALAAALGVAAAIATAPAVCYADPADSDSGSSLSQAADPSSSPTDTPRNVSVTDAAEPGADPDPTGAASTRDRGSDDTIRAPLDDSAQLDDSTPNDDSTPLDGAVDGSFDEDVDGVTDPPRSARSRVTVRHDTVAPVAQRSSDTSPIDDHAVQDSTLPGDPDVPASDEDLSEIPTALSNPLKSSLFRVPAASSGQMSAAAASAIAQAEPVAEIVTTIKEQVVRIIDAAIVWLPSTGPVTDFVEGALLLVRRWLVPRSGVPVSPAVGLNFSLAQADPAPSYADAVKVISDLGVKRIRMYDVNPAALSAIQAQIPDARVTVAVPNSQVAQLANDSSYAATVLESVKPYGVVTTIMVGNEVDTAFANNLPTVTAAVKNMQNAIAAADLPIDVTVSFTTGIVVDTYPPSASRLNPNLHGLTELLGQLKSHAEINIYPLFAIVSNPQDIALDYALGSPTSKPVDDNGVIYHSLFWAQYDGALWAFQKAGIDLPLYVGESGWATDSTSHSPYSTTENAQTYNQNLVTSMLTTGSPKFGVKEFPFYLFEFSDENGKKDGTFEPYWGWYAVTGGALSQKYPLTFSAPAPTSAGSNTLARWLIRAS